MPVGGHLWTEIREGVHALIQTPLLRALTVSGMVGVIGFAIQGAVGILFLTREIGLGAALVLGNFFWVVGGLMTPLAGFAGLTLPYLVVGGVLASFGATIFSVKQM